MIGRSCLILLLAAGAAACDHGFAPPEPAPGGTITGTITYVGTWPPEDQVRDLRFVAMRFVPQDTLDFLQLNRMAISTRLRYGVSIDTFSIAAIEPGVFVYSGVAQQQTSDLLSWRPIGLVGGDGGIFTVASGAATPVEVTVDFAHPPRFPPTPNAP